MALLTSAIFVIAAASAFPWRQASIARAPCSRLASKARLAIVRAMSSASRRQKGFCCRFADISARSASTSGALAQARPDAGVFLLDGRHPLGRERGELRAVEQAVLRLAERKPAVAGMAPVEALRGDQEIAPDGLHARRQLRRIASAAIARDGRGQFFRGPPTVVGQVLQQERVAVGDLRPDEQPQTFRVGGRHPESFGENRVILVDVAVAGEGVEDAEDPGEVAG